MTSFRGGVERLESRLLLTADLGIIAVELPRAVVEPGEEIRLVIEVANVDGIATRAHVSSELGPEVLQDPAWQRIFRSRLNLDRENEALNGQNGFVLQTSRPVALGSSVSGIGDVNGDGVDDLAISGSRASTADGQNVGEVFVVFGATQIGQTGVIDVASLDESDGFILRGSEANSFVGWSIAGAGDVNADGFHDLVVSAVANVPEAGGLSGAYIVFGGNNDNLSTVLNVSELDGDNGFAVEGTLGPGRAAVDVGDLNGDGIDDILFSTYTSEADQNEVNVLFGGPDVGSTGAFDLFDLNGANGFTFTSDPMSFVGFDLSGRGDVNGDGVNDLIITAESGTLAYVLYGAPDVGRDGFSDAADLDGTSGFKVLPKPTGLSGFSVSIAGDVNGDTFDDFLVGDVSAGTDGEAYLVFGGEDLGAAGNVLVADIVAGHGVQLFTSPTGIKDEELGYSISGAGDINGDGVDDIVLGAPNANGRNGAAFIVLGGTHLNTKSTFDVSEELDGSNGFVLSEADLFIGTNDPRIGESVSGAGDVNDDGFDDIIIGSNNGEGYVVFGHETRPRGETLDEEIEILPGAPITYLFTATVPADASGQLTWTVHVDVADPAQPDSNPSNNTVTVTIDVASPDLAGDINRDGEVNFDDFLILSTNFGKDIVATPHDGDLNGDQIVNFADFLILSVNFGRTLQHLPAPPNEDAVDSLLAEAESAEGQETNWLWRAEGSTNRSYMHGRFA